jgi:hypothetical protein
MQSDGFLRSASHSGARDQAIPAALAALLLVLMTAVTQAQTTTRVSVSSAGALANNGSDGGSISADGRYVVFQSLASNLVAGDSNNVHDIFLRDRQTGTTTRISVSSLGTQANNASYGSEISRDGRIVAITSDASNLVTGDGNGTIDLFFRDMQTGMMTRVMGLGGSEPNGNFIPGVFSDDGRYLSFVSAASNLVANDLNGTQDVFVHDLETGSSERVSVATGGAEANAASRFPFVSGDGRYVVFDSLASNLVAPDSNAAFDIYLRDRQLGTTVRISTGLGGAPTNGDSLAAALSSDVRYVAFTSSASNLVAGDTNAQDDLFVYDRVANTTVRISVGPGGVQANSGSGISRFAPDPRYVYFSSFASNLVAVDGNGSIADMFLHDRQTGSNSLLTLGTGGVQGDRDSFGYSHCGSFNCYVFRTSSTNLDPADSNGVADVWVRDFVPLPLFANGFE